MAFSGIFQPLVRFLWIRFMLYFSPLFQAGTAQPETRKQSKPGPSKVLPDSSSLIASLSASS
jgi:hypothetical protein